MAYILYIQFRRNKKIRYQNHISCMCVLNLRDCWLSSALQKLCRRNEWECQWTFEYIICTLTLENSFIQMKCIHSLLSKNIIPETNLHAHFFFFFFFSLIIFSMHLMFSFCGKCKIIKHANHHRMQNSGKVYSDNIFRSRCVACCHVDFCILCHGNPCDKKMHVAYDDKYNNQMLLAVVNH